MNFKSSLVLICRIFVSLPIFWYLFFENNFKSSTPDSWCKHRRGGEHWKSQGNALPSKSLTNPKGRQALWLRPRSSLGGGLHRSRGEAASRAQSSLRPAPACGERELLCRESPAVLAGGGARKAKTTRPEQLHEGTEGGSNREGTAGGARLLWGAPPRPQRRRGAGADCTDSRGDGGLRGGQAVAVHASSPPGRQRGLSLHGRVLLIPGSHAMAAEIWKHRNGWIHYHTIIMKRYFAKMRQLLNATQCPWHF